MFTHPSLFPLFLIGACAASHCAANEFDWVDSGRALVIAKAAEANTHAAYSSHSGKWTTHQFPDGVKAVPVVADDLAVFQLSGKPIEQLVAVDKQGRWQVCSMKKTDDEGPRPNSVTPIVGSEVAVVQIGNRHYAFSGSLGRWDVFVADKTPAPQEADQGFQSNVPYVDSNRVFVHSGNRMAIFSAATGKWAVSPPLATR